jgi:hypothetical protein
MVQEDLKKKSGNHLVTAGNTHMASFWEPGPGTRRVHLLAYQDLSDWRESSKGMT